MTDNKIDFTKVRVGDTVTVRMVVRELDDRVHRPVHVNCTDDLEGGVVLWPPIDDIVSHEPAALKIGDRVRTPHGDPLTGTVEGVSGDYAWVSIDGCAEQGPVTSRVSTLERI